METRTNLKKKLTELGLYENGMDFDQMKQVLNAVDESKHDTPFNPEDIELALRESEKDFATENICNSTMVGLCENTNVLESSSFGHCQRSFGSFFSTTFSSPEDSECVQRSTIVAEVHHEMDWTPKISSSPNQSRETLKRLCPKRIVDAEDSGITLSANSSLYETTNL